jgi:hypothetical protein
MAFVKMKKPRSSDSRSAGRYEAMLFVILFHRFAPVILSSSAIGRPSIFEFHSLSTTLNGNFARETVIFCAYRILFAEQNSCFENGMDFLLKQETGALLVHFDGMEKPDSQQIQITVSLAITNLRS